MKKKLLVMTMIFVMVFTVFAMTGCGNDEKETGDKIVVGLDDTFAPMGFRDEEGTFHQTFYTEDNKEVG